MDGVTEVLDDLRARLARMEGELSMAREQIATLSATETQLRVELDAAKEQATSAEASMAHVQRLGDERVETLRAQVSHLSERLDEACRSREQAEQERAAVIAAMGWRARRRLPNAD